MQSMDSEDLVDMQEAFSKLVKSRSRLSESSHWNFDNEESK